MHSEASTFTGNQTHNPSPHLSGLCPCSTSLFCRWGLRPAPPPPRQRARGGSPRRGGASPCRSCPRWPPTVSRKTPSSAVTGRCWTQCPCCRVARGPPPPPPPRIRGPEAAAAAGGSGSRRPAGPGRGGCRGPRAGRTTRGGWGRSRVTWRSWGSSCHGRCPPPGGQGPGHAPPPPPRGRRSRRREGPVDRRPAWRRS